jgi:hypothetical protein
MKRNSSKEDLRRVELNQLAATYGRAVRVPNDGRIACLAVDCSYHYQQYQSEREQHNWQEIVNRRIGPVFAELLGDALCELNPQPFEDFAKVIKAVASDRTPQTRTFQYKAVRLAEQIRQEHGLPHLDPLPVTQLEFLTRLDPKRVKLANQRKGNSTLHDALRFERKQLARLGIRFASRGGRPRKNRGTGNPKT